MKNNNFNRGINNREMDNNKKRKNDLVLSLYNNKKKVANNIEIELERKKDECIGMFSEIMEEGYSISLKDSKIRDPKKKLIPINEDNIYSGKTCYTLDLDTEFVIQKYVNDKLVKFESVETTSVKMHLGDDKKYGTWVEDSLYKRASIENKFKVATLGLNFISARKEKERIEKERIQEQQRIEIEMNRQRIENKNRMVKGFKKMQDRQQQQTEEEEIEEEPLEEQIEYVVADEEEHAQNVEEEVNETIENTTNHTTVSESTTEITLN